MLVSSIGYLNMNNYAKSDVVVKSQSVKNNLYGGFGNYDEQTKCKPDKFSVLKSYLNSLLSVFNSNKSVDNSKSLSVEV